MHYIKCYVLILFILSNLACNFIKNKKFIIILHKILAKTKFIWYYYIALVMFLHNELKIVSLKFVKIRCVVVVKI